MIEAAGVGLLYQDLVLLAKRVDTWKGKTIAYGGYWSIFAGSKEEGESFFSAALRELYEETKITINLEDLKYAQPIIEENLRLELYFVRLSDKLMPDLNPEEHTEFGWFKVDELDNFPYNICPHIVSRIKKFCKSKY
jgi:8-oxo-dGTP pyrophosphatase MutT (NUDIX family)